MLFTDGDDQSGRETKEGADAVAGEVGENEAKAQDPVAGELDDHGGTTREETREDEGKGALSGIAQTGDTAGEAAVESTGPIGGGGGDDLTAPVAGGSGDNCIAPVAGGSGVEVFPAWPASSSGYGTRGAARRRQSEEIEENTPEQARAARQQHPLPITEGERHRGRAPEMTRCRGPGGRDGPDTAHNRFLAVGKGQPGERSGADGPRIRHVPEVDEPPGGSSQGLKAIRAGYGGNQGLWPAEFFLYLYYEGLRDEQIALDISAIKSAFLSSHVV